MPCPPIGPVSPRSPTIPGMPLSPCCPDAPGGPAAPYNAQQQQLSTTTTVRATTQAIVNRGAKLLNYEERDSTARDITMEGMQRTQC